MKGSLVKPDIRLFTGPYSEHQDESSEATYTIENLSAPTDVGYLVTRDGGTAIELEEIRKKEADRKARDIDCELLSKSFSTQ